jgi:hypothetical protein
MLKIISALLICFLVSFSWGIAAGYYQIFPFPLLKETKAYVLDLLPREPKAKNYRPAARFLTSTAHRREVACPSENPITFVALGQSNAANSLSSFGDLDPAAAAYQFYDGKCYLMEDPAIGSTGYQGSLWTEFAQSFSAATGRGVVFITSAVEGSGVGDWLDPQSGYFERAERQIEQAIAAGLTPRFVLWHQGETDALIRTPAEDYTAMLLSLIERVDRLFEAEAEPTWIVFQATVCRNTPDGSSRIIAAQKAVTEQHARAVLGPNTDRLGPRYRFDDCHFNANGKAWIVKELQSRLLDLGVL